MVVVASQNAANPSFAGETQRWRVLSHVSVAGHGSSGPQSWSEISVFDATEYHILYTVPSSSTRGDRSTASPLRLPCSTGAGSGVNVSPSDDDARPIDTEPSLAENDEKNISHG